MITEYLLMQILLYLLVFQRIFVLFKVNTIYDVIYQPNQFSCVWNGRLDRTAATEEVCQLVREELVNRCNYEVLYFTAGNYGKYGEHLFQVGNHYFCGE